MRTPDLLHRIGLTPLLVCVAANIIEPAIPATDSQRNPKSSCETHPILYSVVVGGDTCPFTHNWCRLNDGEIPS